ncbi:S-adenosyl-L-methionine-dependent methyltransferase [Lichtheimia hyalospora FSU 10163]|nr:S-adenosyl-L-methionine-dependent methyltransferase [Lichtheimia hyalospora FSU 10163]
MGGQLSKAGLPGIERNSRARRKTVSSSSSSHHHQTPQHTARQQTTSHKIPAIIDHTQSVPNASSNYDKTIRRAVNKKEGGLRRTNSTVAMQRGGSVPNIPSSQRITRDTAKATAAAIHQRRLDLHSNSTPSFSSDESSSTTTPLSASPSSSITGNAYTRSIQSTSVNSQQDYAQDFTEEQEYNRHQRQHYVFKQVIGDNIKCTFDKPPKHILDSACGAGFWVLETAQAYPDAQVVALGSTLPIPVKSENNGGESSSSGSSRLPFPKNVNFVHGSVQSPPLPFSDNTFDLVHQREVGILLPFQCWQPLLVDIHRILKPGGIIHLVEYDMAYPENCGPLCDRTNEAVRRATKDMGFAIYITEPIERMLHQIGFRNVQVQRFYVPVGEWPDDEIGLQHGFLLKQVATQLLKRAKPRLGTLSWCRTRGL